MDAASWFTDSVTLKTATGSTAYGDPTYGSPRTINAVIKTQMRKEATAQGVVVHNISIIITDQPITQGDLIWLPGADTSSAAEAQRLGIVRTAHDKYGAVSFYEADLL